MAAPRWFFGFDSLMEIIAFVIAVAVAYQALKGYRLSKERTLLYLNFSFILLGAGLLIDSLSNVFVLMGGFHRGLLFLSAIGYTINFIAQFLAFGILVVAYIHQTRSVSSQATLVVLPAVTFFEHNALAELILMFLLIFISAQTGINYGVTKAKNALLVFAAFASLAVSHFFFLLFTFAPIFFPFAHIAQLFGFLLLLAMLLRVNQPQ